LPGIDLIDRQTLIDANATCNKRARLRLSARGCWTTRNVWERKKKEKEKKNQATEIGDGSRMPFSESSFPVLFHSRRRHSNYSQRLADRPAGRPARRRDEIRSGANGKFHGEFMTYRNGGRNYRQIRPLTLYEPPKRGQCRHAADTRRLGSAWPRATERATTAEERDGAGARVAERDVLHSRPPRWHRRY